VGNAPLRRTELWFLIVLFSVWFELGAIMLKLLSAVVAAAGIAGVLTLLPGAPSAPLSVSPPAKPQQVSDTCVDRPWPYLNCVVSQLDESRPKLLTADRVTPGFTSLSRASDAQILLEKSQMQDW
jgi:hypothetical protein